MSWICQYKEPFTGKWKEKEFETEDAARYFARFYKLSEVYHS